MVRLGKTFGNLMVDLRATNNKLRARTNRIVRQLTGLTQEQAADLLERCGHELKTALVSQLAAVTPDEARTRLQAAGGQVRRALMPANPVVVKEVPDLYLGIDGGGTHTVALLARAERGSDRGWVLLARGEAGPSNLHAVGTARALESLDQAVSKAFAGARLGRQPVAAACLGLAGAGRAEDQAMVQDWAKRVTLAAAVQVTADTPLLLAAGTPDGWGVALVAGTGSMAFARDREGRTTRAGGWGYLLGDEGSGYALVMAALQAVVRAADGRGPATALTERLLARLGLARAPELIGAVYRGDRGRTALAALAPLIFETAEAGDELAGQIVSAAAEQLSATVAAAARQLSLERTAFPLALAGGVLLASRTYRETILTALALLGLRAEPVTLVREPAEGALRLALARVLMAG
jgi:N-acetylglucosamine kinase-like BadF-type ATPase